MSVMDMVWIFLAFVFLPICGGLMAYHHIRRKADLDLIEKWTKTIRDLDDGKGGL